ncbi:hypothetical protein [Flavobacterium inviolabile]|uniref:hypothetical protein n=1 Tax=Flavobacterium inviolabile TaxID=2748320 RepID=UPI0015AB2AF5|nr:hypothetical protein [Flavobacterium inviolabile]
MKKLESLRQDKFQSFKENEIQNAFNIIGGVKVATTIGGSPDCYDYRTNETGSVDGGGTPRDFWYRDC